MLAARFGCPSSNPAKKSSIGVLSPRLFSERSPSAITLKGFLFDAPNGFHILARDAVAMKMAADFRNSYGLK
jgi:hypothetical protein